MIAENFNLIEFTDKYLWHHKEWYYFYYRTFLDLTKLLEEPVELTQYFVREVSIAEMLKIIESKVSLEWFLDHDIGAAYIRNINGVYELFYKGERGSDPEIIARDIDLRKIVALKLKEDLFWIHVQKIND